MMTHKRPKFAAGELLEIPLGTAGFGCVQVIQLENFGALIAVFDLLAPEHITPDVVSSRRLEVLTKAYVNTASARKRWKHVGDLPLRPDVSKIPVFFYGRSMSGWTVQYPDGTTKFASGGSVDRNGMIAKGYIQKVLWLAQDIEQLIAQGQPLSWPGAQ